MSKSLLVPARIFSKELKRWTAFGASFEYIKIDPIVTRLWGRKTRRSGPKSPWVKGSTMAE